MLNNPRALQEGAKRALARVSVVRTMNGSQKDQSRATEAIKVPAALVAFWNASPTAEVAAVLGVSDGRVRQLRLGIAGGISSGILKRWASFQAKRAGPVGGWHLRRVRRDGTLALAGVLYSAPGLAARAGQQVTVARVAEGGLLVQPVERRPDALRADAVEVAL